MALEDESFIPAHEQEQAGFKATNQKVVAMSTRRTSEASEERQDLAPRYDVIDGGLYYIGTKRDRDTGKLSDTAPQWLCNAVEVLGNGCDHAGRQYRLLQFVRQGNGEQIRLALPCAEIGERDGWATLRNLGLAVSNEAAARNRLAYYLQKEGSTDWYEIVSMTGWQQGAFILPSGEIIGTPARAIHFNGKSRHPSAYRPAGTLQSWRSTVGAKARGNPLVVVGIACALAGPLLSIINAKDGIGLHLYTNTSSGKTTTAEAAASVWGHPERTRHTWSGTPLGLSLAAEGANDMMLVLDEIGAGDARKIGPAIYQMLNGISKLQGARDGGTIASRTWLLTLISTGEVPMSQYLAEGGQRPRGGQEIRLLDIPADQGEFRAFDCIHGCADSEVFANELTAAALANYGTLGPAFVAWLASRREEAKARVADAQRRMLALLPAEAAPTVRRATRKFAVLCAAAEMASDAGLTGWTRAEAEEWVQTAWTRWLTAFGLQDRDDARLIEQVEGLLQTHQHSRFLPQQPHAREPQMANLMGYKREESDGRILFSVLPMAFKTELVAGFDPRRACEVLHKAGMLERPSGRNAWTVNGGKNIGQVYRVRLRNTEDNGIAPAGEQ